jgi:hypothetical protein
MQQDYVRLLGGQQRFRQLTKIAAAGNLDAS